MAVNIADAWDPLNAQEIVTPEAVGIAHDAVFVSFSNGVTNGSPGITYNSMADYNTGDFIEGTTYQLVDIYNIDSGIVVSRGKNLFGTGWMNGDGTAISTGNLFIDEYLLQRQGRLAKATNEFRYVDMILAGLEDVPYTIKACGYYATVPPIYQCIRVTDDVADPLIVDETYLGQLAGPGETLSAGVREDPTIMSDWNRSTVEGGMETGAIVTFTPVGGTVRLRFESLHDSLNLYLVVGGWELRKL